MFWGRTSGRDARAMIVLSGCTGEEDNSRLWSRAASTNERLLRPRLRNRGAPAPRGAGADRARPPGSPPHSVALHARRSDPKVSQSVSYFTVPPRAHPSTGSQSGSADPKASGAKGLQTPRATKPRMHAGVSDPRRTPNYPRGAGREDSHPHLRPPAAALRRARPPPSDVGRAPPLNFLFGSC